MSTPPLISFVAAAYEYYPVLLPSLMAQRFPHWECVLIHDGPSQQYERWAASLDDPRIRLHCTAERKGGWGHPHRALGISMVHPAARLVCVTNADNYYVPSFCGEVAAIGARAVYTDMVHSYWSWTVISSELRHAGIDCGAWVVEADVARRVGWPWLHKDADWTFVEGCLGQIGGPAAARRIPRPLFVHN